MSLILLLSISKICAQSGCIYTEIDDRRHYDNLLPHVIAIITFKILVVEPAICTEAVGRSAI